MRYTVVSSQVQVIGHIWMPSTIAAMDYSMSSYDVENARDDDGKITRESVERWLSMNSGDFQSVDDFRADIADGDTDIVIDWADPDSEMTYGDCMYPENWS